MSTTPKPKLEQACTKHHPSSGPPVPARRLVCTNCGRSICEWHSAASPVAVDGTVRLVTVCHPAPCDGPFWNPPHSKGRAA